MPHATLLCCCCALRRCRTSAISSLWPFAFRQTHQLVVGRKQHNHFPFALLANCDAFVKYYRIPQTALKSLTGDVRARSEEKGGHGPEQARAGQSLKKMARDGGGARQRKSAAACSPAPPTCRTTGECITNSGTILLFGENTAVPMTTTARSKRATGASCCALRMVASLPRAVTCQRVVVSAVEVQLSRYRAHHKRARQLYCPTRASTKAILSLLLFSNHSDACAVCLTR